MLSLQQESRKRWLVDLRVRASGSGCGVRLSIEALRAPSWLGAQLQGMRLNRLCRTVIERLVRHQRNSAVVGPARVILPMEV